MIAFLALYKAYSNEYRRINAIGFRKNCYIETPFYANWRGKNVHIGDNFYSNYNLMLVDDGEITIGNYVMIAPNVILCSATHQISPNLRANNIEYNLPVRIGNRVWIGANAIMMPGVTIGDNSIIGVGSIATKEISPDVIAFGNPCKVHRKITEQDEIEIKNKE